MNHEMLKGFLYARLGHRAETNCESFIEGMADYFDVEEITEQDVREAVADLIKEQYVIYGQMDQNIVATTPEHLTPDTDDKDGDSGE